MALLLKALLAVPEGEEITPAQLREQTGLTLDQSKEAILAASVKELFHTGFTTFGSGKNQKIRRIPVAKVAYLVSFLRLIGLSASLFVL